MYPNVYQEKHLEYYDHVLIDMNYLLHYCSYHINDIECIYNKLYHLIDTILNNVVPTKSITFALDGVAPLAKLKLQKQRRKHMIKNNVEIQLSVGTEFMNNLKDKMKNYLEFVSKVFNVTVNFDDSDYDEAEIKIERKIIELSNNSNNVNDSFIIISSDTDVIVMMMMLKQYDSIYIYIITTFIIII